MLLAPIRDSDTWAVPPRTDRFGRGPPPGRLQCSVASVVAPRRSQVPVCSPRDPERTSGRSPPLHLRPASGPQGPARRPGAAPPPVAEVGHEHMPRPRKAGLNVRLAGGVAMLLLTYGCDARELTAPGPSAAASRLSVTEPAGIGSTLLTPPPTSSPADVASITPVPFASAPESTWVVVTVSGELRLELNPECDLQAPNWPCQLGSPTTSFESDPGTYGPVAV